MRTIHEKVLVFAEKQPRAAAKRTIKACQVEVPQACK